MLENEEQPCRWDTSPGNKLLSSVDHHRYLQTCVIAGGDFEGLLPSQTAAPLFSCRSPRVAIKNN